MNEVPPLPPLSGIPAMPSSPRGLDGPSVSEIIPFRSSKINILKSGILIPFGVTAIVCVLLFSISNFYHIMYVFSAYLLFAIFYAAYAYSGLKTNLAIYAIPVAIIYFEITTPIVNVFAFVFRTILPGADPVNPNFVNTFISNFFAAGLMEELMKAVPALIGLYVCLHNANRAPSGSGLRPGGWLRCSTPLEGVMIGLAAGAGFIFVETLYQYVPNTVVAVAKTEGAGAGFANGFALLFPRVLNGVIGHMAWAGISGYFIGMVALYPKSALKLLAIGWLTPALLHAFWNASSYLGPVGKWASAALSLSTFVVCLLKAKQLETARQGSSFVPTDSIIVGDTRSPAAAGASIEQHGTAPGGIAQILTGFFQPKTGTPTPVGSVSPIAAAPQAAPGVSPTPRYALSNGAQRYGITPGQTIDLAVLFPTAGLPARTLAEVTVHPTNAEAIGLKNMTSETWTVALEGGAMTNVAAGKNVKLVANAKIRIGAATIDVQAL